MWHGVSRHQQIEELTGRGPLHLAQLLMMALSEGPGGYGGDLPERRWVASVRPPEVYRLVMIAVAAGAGILLGTVNAAIRRRKRGRDEE